MTVLKLKIFQKKEGGVRKFFKTVGKGEKSLKITNFKIFNFFIKKILRNFSFPQN